MKRFYFSKLVILCALLLGLNWNATAQCNCAYGYKVPITVTNLGATALTNYQVSITVNTAALVTAGKMLASGNDIRFTDNSCTNLSYWIESGMNTASTKIWIKVNSIPASGTATVNMYYGNPAAAAASDGVGTFIFFDDFNGSSVNAAMWNTANGGGTITVGGGTISLNWTSSILLETVTAYNAPYYSEMKVNSTSGSWPCLGQENGSGNVMFMSTGNGAMYSGPTTGFPYSSNLNNSIGLGSTAGIWSFAHTGVGATVAYSWPGGSNSTAATLNTPGATLKTSFGGLQSSTGGIVVDWIRGRVYYAAGTSQTLGAEVANVTPPITGTLTVCGGGGITNLSDAGAGGTWTSSNPSSASVSATGVVTGGNVASTTTVTISYSIGACSSASATVTVNPAPSAIPGAPFVCTGQTINLPSSPSGGSWTSSSNLQATVDAGGNVTGVALGTPTITYTLPVTNCFTTKVVTVNASPAAISPASPQVCSGSTLNLSDATAGGTWSSVLTSVATVGSTGVATGGTSTGTTTINYTMPNGCVASASLVVNPLPAPVFVTGGGGYCIGETTPPAISTGAAGLSTLGTSYQLVLGGVTPIGPAQSGNAAGTGLNFGVQTTPGSYTVVATIPATGCSRVEIGSPTVVANPLPVQFTLTGGGSYCDLGTGVNDTLSGSVIGTLYQLVLNGVTNVGLAKPGTGSALVWPNITAPGIYTVVARISATTCNSIMIGSTPVTINPLPNSSYNIIPNGSAAYCVGGTGVVDSLSFSNIGISYQLYKDGVPTGSPVMGTGLPISFGPQTAVGTYQVYGTNVSTGCYSTMSGTSTLNTVDLPNVHGLTSSGTSFCAGGTGIDIGLDGSDNVNYYLYNGTSLVTVQPGTGGPFTIATVTTAGTYTAVAVDPVYGCTTNMTGSITVSVNALPTVYTVSGGGSYCMGGTGKDILLSNSQSGVTYYLQLDGSTVGSTVSGGGPLDFPGRTVAGVYTVYAMNGSGCTSNMLGSATITVDPPPAIYNVTGGGNYCAGGTGMLLGLDVSSIGVNYQLYISGSIPVGSPVAGTGLPISFGLHTAAGTYSVVATNVSTGCIATMSGTPTIGIYALPGLHTVTGGGQYCAGGTGYHVGLSSSDLGIRYQLFNGVTPVGDPMDGTGAALDYGIQTAAGVYTIVATDTTTLCNKTMTGLAVIVVNPLPTVYTVTGGGIYCVGGSGMHIGLSGSNVNVHYQLWNGSTLITTVPGTGASIDFGAQISAGLYTVVGVDNVTACTKTMSGSAVIAINPLPTVYTVTGGGSYCADGTGPNVGLSGSNTTISYQLYRNGVALGLPVAGTGAAIDFGAQTAAGVYTVVATDMIAGCVKNMAGSATISINSLPIVFTVLGGGNYCAGGTGYHIYLNSSTPGVSYQLMMDTAMIGLPVAGTGVSIDFGLQSAAGTYTAVATNPGTGCTSNMTGSATINVNPLPTLHNVTVTDGGNYCVTGTGVHIGLDGSDNGIRYQLYHGGTFLGAAMSGTGSALDFGLHTAGTYTIVATNTATSCTNTMTGSAVINAIPLPTVYAVTGGGYYCETGLGVHVGLSGTDAGTSYQLYFAGAPSGAPVTGTGAAMDFGLKTANGTYTVVAYNGTTSCNKNMSGSAVVTVYPVIIPVVNMSTVGGDTVCVGSLTTFNASPINGGSSPSYQWMVNGMPYGTGSTYSYVPLDGDVVTVMLTSNGICAIPDTASKSVKLTVSPPQMPAVHVAVSPGDIICQGSSATFTATTLYGGSSPVINWLKNSVSVGSGLTYSYTPANNDVIVVEMKSNFPCRISDDVFSNTNTMVVEPAVIPIVSIAANPGTNVATGQTVTFTATVTHGGSAPTYQWLVNGLQVNGATAKTYTSSSLANNDSVTCEVVGGCALSGFNSVIVHMANVGVQQITSAGSNDIRLIPNPNKGTFTVKGTLSNTNDQEVSLEVTNMVGQVIYTKNVPVQNGVVNELIQLNSTLANGMYLLNLRSGSQDNIFHFVIEQ